MVSGIIYPMPGQIILIHDRPDFAEVKAELLSRQLECKVIPVTTAKEAMELISKGLGKVDTVIVHKDQGQYSKEEYTGSNRGWVDDIVEAIHKENETVRIGILSGEFPNGIGHVKELKADFYLSPEDTVREESWFLEQLQKGPVSPKEIGKRGQEVAMPSGPSAAERLY